MSVQPFGEILKKYREAHGLSQQQLADILGTTKQVLSRYETGQRDPKISVVQAYSETLGISLPQLLDGESPPPVTESSFAHADHLIKVEEAPPASTDGTLSNLEQQLLSLFRKLPPEKQEALLNLLTSDTE